MLGTKTNLHVISIVKARGHHVEDMIDKEGNKAGDNGKPSHSGVVDCGAEVEGEEGGEDGGQGGEVVGLLSCRGVHRVEH